jgi:hypothetical protein
MMDRRCFSFVGKFLSGDAVLSKFCTVTSLELFVLGRNIPVG